MIFLMVTLFSIKAAHCFIPAEFMNNVLSNLNNSRLNSEKFGEINATITHDEIIRRGIIRSVGLYFYNQPNGKERINMTRLSMDGYDVNSLYKVYYDQDVCNIPLDKLLKRTFEPNVARVDFDRDTSGLPFAHFDAEKFYESNRRVINFTNSIYTLLRAEDYDKARELSAQILHTIQDFYSHSNWIENGFENEINVDIGTIEFESKYKVAKLSTQTCISNCSMVQIECSWFFTKLADIVNFFRIRNSSLNQCPIQYYECDGNIIDKNELTSGYYSNQELPNGTKIEKPTNDKKCSHGGVLDKTATQKVVGGINKDSGYYMFSPIAHLHLKAANLAVKHTEYFYNQLRKNIGDAEYSKFFDLDLKSTRLNGLLRC